METEATMEARTKSGSTPVLVVGGSLVGLSAAMFLAWRGVPTVVVEKHPGSSLLPRAVGYTTRTLEIFRPVGIGSAIPEVPAGQGRPRRVAVESLAGKWAAEAEWSPGKPQSAGSDGPPPPEIGYSPVTGAAIAQDRLEPILRDRAIELGADIRWNFVWATVLQSWDAPPSTGSSATIVNVASNARDSIALATSSG